MDQTTRINRHGCLECGGSVYFTRSGVCEDCEREGYWMAEEDYEHG